MRSRIMNMHEKVLWLQTEFPELWQAMDDANHNFSIHDLNPYHLEGRVSTHTLMVAKIAEIYNENEIIQWAALLHDLGKPLARIEIPEKRRARFVNHEGISMFLAIDILNKTDLSTDDKIQVLKVIAGHSLLFDLLIIKDENTIDINDDVYKLFKGQKTFLDLVSRITRCDTLGRFAKGADARTHLGDSIVPAIQNILPKFIDQDSLDYNEKDKALILLCGLPGSGKSSYVNLLNDDYFIISRDSILEAMATKMGITYNDVFALHLVDHKIKEEIDINLNMMINDSKKSGKHIVIDMTNLSKKARRRWTNRYDKSYKKECIVFLTGQADLIDRDNNRSKTGKTIGADVYLSMMKSFSLPMFSDGFDNIDYILHEGTYNKNG